MHSGNSEIENISVIIAAAGSGKRMNLDKKKQFLEFKGKPLFMSSLIESEKCSLVGEIIVVTSEEDIEYVKWCCQKEKISKLKAVVKGGKERQDSIFNGLKEVTKNFVAIQDGARPFLKQEYFIDGIKLLEEKKILAGVVVAVKLKDTVKVLKDNGEVDYTPNRDFLIAVQTPQIFYSTILKKAYENAKIKNIIGTDDSSLVESLGEKIGVIPGDYKNIKITTIEDLYCIKN
ncbi:MAG: 2-C-methyl-D-erythritol 4-phosphate cytidylyltransferase [Fusobacteriaceae bacterium]